MKSIVTIAADFSDRIKDGRTNGNVLDHMQSEVVELHEEICAVQYGTEKGPDGVFGECIDIIACALDIIRRERPNATMEELEAECSAYMEIKCQKWFNKSVNA